MPIDEERWMEEEISYEQHIERMDRIRNERRDRVYPAPPRDRRITLPNEGERTALNYSIDDWRFNDPEEDRVTASDVVRARGRNDALYQAYLTAMGNYYSLMPSTDGVNSLELEKPKKNLIGGELL